MGIYSRKRKKSGFRVFILSLFVLSIFLVLGYYFFYPNNLKTVLDENLSDKIVETQNEVEVEKVSETNENEYFQSEINIDLSNYLEKSDLDKSIKDFIQNNPEFIINVLSKYQDEQNKIEQEKTSQLNNLNIISLNLFDNLDTVWQSSSNICQEETITFTFKEPIFLEFMVFQNPESTTVFEESIIVATLGITSDNESKYFVSKELEYDNTSQWIDINSEILYDLTLKIVRNYPQNIDNQESRCAIQEVIFYGRDLNK